MAAVVTPMTDTELTRYGRPEAEGGIGAMRTSSGNLPLDQIDLRATITGLMAGIELVQGFLNPFGEPVEATYVFPLPDRAAVTGMRMEADGRIVEAVIKERGQARADYDSAISQGQRASIAEQERSDVFTMRVGNIMPGERVLVRLSLAGLLPFEDGAATFRMPLVVAPRYIPGVPLPGVPVGDGYAPDTDAVPDASRITPPVLLPGFPNPVRLSAQVDIDPAGMPLPELRSSLRATITQAAASTHDEGAPPPALRVRLDPGQRTDRDFVLRLGFGPGQAVSTGLAAHRDDAGSGAGGTFALTLVPPAASGEGRPKDVALVLDRSGSMHGWKIVAAARAAARIVDSLASADRFAVLAFDNQIDRPQALPDGLADATDAHRFQAVAHLASMTARGGTEMLAPLLQAARLLADGEPGAGRDKVLVLVTDGQVGNEDQILRELDPVLGASREHTGIRVHTVGVDTAVHEGFLRSLAALSGGRCELVESADRLDEAMRAIHQRIATPVLTDLRIEPLGLPADLATLAPARLPDLYEGAPVVITGRTQGAPAGSLVITGSALDGTQWRQVVEASSSASAALTSVWARMHIGDMEDRYVTGNLEGAAALEEAITATSLRFGVLSRFTALIAVDTRVVNEGGATHRVIQPVEMPHGWEMAGLPQPGGLDAMGLATAGPMGGGPVVAGPVVGGPVVGGPVAGGPVVGDSAVATQAASAGGLFMRSARAPRQGKFRTRASAGTAGQASPPLAPAPAIPASVLEFAAEWQASLRRLSAATPGDRAAGLAGLAAEIRRRIDQFANDGLGRALLAQLRELAADLPGASGGPAPLHRLWLRATDMLEALTATRGQDPGDRAAAFWRRNP